MTDKIKTPYPCDNCGECCRVFGGDLEVSEGDMARWKREGRYDILQYAERMFGINLIWVNPVRNLDMESCPFLREGSGGNYCDIEKTKPEVCAQFACEKMTDGCKTWRE